MITDDSTRQDSKLAGALSLGITIEKSAEFSRTLSELKKVVDKDVMPWHNFFKRNADLSRLLFRISGTAVIISSASIPVMAAFDFRGKNFALSVFALLIAILTGLNSFYRWESRWRVYRQSQFSVDQLVSEWELKLIDAEKRYDKESSLKAIEATIALLQNVKQIRVNETKAYFDNVQWPQPERKA